MHTKKQRTILLREIQKKKIMTDDSNEAMIKLGLIEEEGGVPFLYRHIPCRDLHLTNPNGISAVEQLKKYAIAMHVRKTDKVKHTADQRSDHHIDLMYQDIDHDHVLILTNRDIIYALQESNKIGHKLKLFAVVSSSVAPSISPTVTPALVMVVVIAPPHSDVVVVVRAQENHRDKAVQVEEIEEEEIEEEEVEVDVEDSDIEEQEANMDSTSDEPTMATGQHHNNKFLEPNDKAYHGIHQVASVTCTPSAMTKPTIHSTESANVLDDNEVVHETVTSTITNQTPPWQKQPSRTLLSSPSSWDIVGTDSRMVDHNGTSSLSSSWPVLPPQVANTGSMKPISSKEEADIPTEITSLSALGDVMTVRGLPQSSVGKAASASSGKPLRAWKVPQSSITTTEQRNVNTRTVDVKAKSLLKIQQEELMTKQMLADQKKWFEQRNHIDSLLELPAEAMIDAFMIEEQMEIEK